MASEIDKSNQPAPIPSVPVNVEKAPVAAPKSWSSLLKSDSKPPAPSQAPTRPTNGPAPAESKPAAESEEARRNGATEERGTRAAPDDGPASGDDNTKGVSEADKEGPKQVESEPKVVKNPWARNVNAAAGAGNVKVGGVTMWPSLSDAKNKEAVAPDHGNGEGVEGSGAPDKEGASPPLGKDRRPREQHSSAASASPSRSHDPRGARSAGGSPGITQGDGLESRGLDENGAEINNSDTSTGASAEAAASGGSSNGNLTGSGSGGVGGNGAFASYAGGNNSNMRAGHVAHGVERKGYSNRQFDGARARGRGAARDGTNGTGRGNFYRSNSAGEWQNRNLRISVDHKHNHSSDSSDGSSSGGRVNTPGRYGQGRSNMGYAQVNARPPHQTLAVQTQGGIPYYTIQPQAYYGGPYTPLVVGGYPQAMAPPSGALRQALQQQIEYYFSVQNLCRDVFLRGQMDEEGWINVKVIAAFNRVRMMTLDPKAILDCVRDSTHVEVQGERLRRRGDWKSWILPKVADKKPALPPGRAPRQRNGYVQAGKLDQSAPPPMPNVPFSAPLPTTAAPSHVRLQNTGLSTDTSLAKHTAAVAAAEAATASGTKAESTDTETSQQDSATSSATADGVSGHDLEHLVVVIKHEAGDSNGSSKSVEVGKVDVSAGVDDSESIGFYFKLVPGDGGTQKLSDAEALNADAYRQLPYAQFYKECTAKRQSASGATEDMKVLFRFWSYFLRSNFDASMYEEFLKLAEEDAEQEDYFGLQCVFRLYSRGLGKTFRPDLYKQFEELALKYYKLGNSYGMQQLWSFHSQQKGVALPVTLDPALEAIMTDENVSSWSEQS
eukprot:scaffold1954_cov364-Prasinococcus_capsulatus_cf.AAC.2